MKGYIGSREKCEICQGRLVHDERRKGCFCLGHPHVCARTYYVKFGRDIYKRFKNYDLASRFLTGLRFKSDEGSFDKRDYRKDNPLGFENQVEKYLEYKANTNIDKKTVQSYRNFLTRAIKQWRNKSIKEITDGDVEDLLFDQSWKTPKGDPASLKTRHNMKSCLNDFWSWVVRREKRSGKNIIEMPVFPEISYTLGWRNRTDIQTLVAILDEIKRISWDINPKIWFGINLITKNIDVRPGEMRMVKEKDINLESGYILISKPKEGIKDFGKYAYLDEDDIAFIRGLPTKGLPFMYFFRHKTGRSGVKAEEQFGPKYFKRWWDKACKNIGVEGVGLYGGTKHTIATALGQVLTPEEIKRGGTGSRTNKAFDRYFQPLRQEKIKVKNAIKGLKEASDKMLKRSNSD